jgi:hypothetical protein
LAGGYGNAVAWRAREVHAAMADGVRRRGPGQIPPSSVGSHASSGGGP